MDARATLHQLLYLALIQIRLVAKRQQPQLIFDLADLLHNVPVQVERAARGEVTYEHVLDELRQRAQDMGQTHVDWIARVSQNPQR